MFMVSIVQFHSVLVSSVPPVPQAWLRYTDEGEEGQWRDRGHYSDVDTITDIDNRK